MIPIRFGTVDRPLTGMYSPAAGAGPRRGVVVCPPIGDEYMRSHRTLRILATRLSESGQDTLRIDYFGTGSSGGQEPDLTLAGAVEDTISAVQEIKDLAAVRRVTVVGLRIGALVAARAAGRARGVDRLVLWDPVRKGTDDLEGFVTHGRGGDVEIKGFVFTGALMEELRKATICGPDVETLPSRVLVVTSQEERAGLDCLSDAPSLEHEHLPNPPAWLEKDYLGVGAVPTDILALIASW